MRLRTINTTVWLDKVLEQSELLLRKCEQAHEIIVQMIDDFPPVIAGR